MSDDNPFAPPSGDPPPPHRPAAPDWGSPAYQEPGYPPGWHAPEPRGRGIPRGLVGACHTSAVAAWVFVASVLAFREAVESATGFFLLIFGAGALLATILVASLAVAIGGLVVAVPLAAIWWGERRERTGESYGEKAALAHLALAWAFAGYWLARAFL